LFAYTTDLSVTPHLFITQCGEALDQVQTLY